MEEVSDFLEETPDISGQDGGRGEEGGGIEIVLLELEAVVVMPLF